MFAMGFNLTSRRLAAVFALSFATVIAGCGSGDDFEDTITREAFIEAYVDLRMSALDSEDQRVDSIARSEILGAHGVTADDLTHFADVHGPRLEFMRDVWADIEVRLDQTPSSN